MTRQTLTDKQSRFVSEYLVDLNSAAAARRAGYSEKTARSQGQRLLTNVDIQAAIEKAMDGRSERTEITQDQVIQELAKLAFGNIKNYYDEDGNLLSPHELSDDVAATITSVDEKILKKGSGANGETVILERKVRMADKKASLELLGKHLKMFTDKVEVDQTNTPQHMAVAEIEKLLAELD